MSEEPNQIPKPRQEKWPVIVHSSLKDGEVVKMLFQRHKVRVAEKTIENTCIFPLSGVAFMILVVHDSTTSWPPPKSVVLKPNIVERLEKFLRVHRRCYLLLIADLHGPQEFGVTMTIQQRFFSQQMNILPLHSVAECVHSMLKIAKVTCQPGSGKLQGWISSVLRAQRVNEENDILHALAQVGLTPHQSSVLLDGLGSIGVIATADKKSLMECSLDAQTAETVIRYFEKDFVTM